MRGVRTVAATGEGCDTDEYSVDVRQLDVGQLYTDMSHTLF